MASPDTVEQVLHAEYRAYLCIMCAHDCQCIALSFDQWLALASL